MSKEPARMLKVLIVDDDAQVRQVMTAVIGRMGFSVVAAEDGFSALAEIRRQMPDIIVSDLFMPKMSGFELLSVVRRRFPWIKVIAMSGSFLANEIPDGVSADGFYPKGSNPRPLIASLEEMATAARATLARNPKPNAFLWIPKIGRDGDGAVFALICCPECLRASPHSLPDQEDGFRATACQFCLQTIRFAVVQIDDSAAKPVFAEPDMQLAAG
jgi:CheY-like chemotaxis protein